MDNKMKSAVNLHNGLLLLMYKSVRGICTLSTVGNLILATLYCVIVFCVKSAKLVTIAVKVKYKYYNILLNYFPLLGEKIRF